MALSKRIVAVLVALLLSTAAHSQPVAASALGKVFYTGKVGFFTKTSEYKIESKSPTVSSYSGNDVLLFDSKTFAVVHMKNAPDNFDPGIVSSASAGTLEIGNTWTAKYKQPPSRPSQCNSPSDQELSATVVAKDTQQFDVGGAKTDVEVVTVDMTGTWSSCTYYGTWKATRKFAPSLGLMISTDSETRYEGSVISGGSLKLDHIER